jgi:hypothetical protein
VSNKWFADDERSLSSTLVMISLVVGKLMESFFVKTFLEEQATFEQGFQAVICIQTGSMIVFSILAVLFIPSEPAFPPSRLALVKEEPLGSLGNICGQVWANKNLIWIIVVDCLTGSLQYPATQLKSQLFVPLGISVKTLVMATVIICILAVSFGIILSMYVDRS